MATTKRVQQYLEARAAGDLDRQRILQGAMKGPELTQLARAIKAADAPGAPAGPTNPTPKEAEMPAVKVAPKPTPTKARVAQVAKPAPAPRPVVAVAPRPEPKVGNVIKPQYRGGFRTMEGLKTASGARVIATSNDIVTQELAGTTTEDLVAIAARCGVDFTWHHLNPGMQRMNLGNRLRSMLRRGELEEAALTAKAPVKAAKPAAKAAPAAKKAAK